MKGRDDTRRVADLAARQYGNVTYGQLLAAGLDDDAIERRCEVGWLIRRHTRVYAVGHVPQARESRWMAAVLALGAGAVLSHASAGALWGMIRGTVRTEVIVPRGGGLAHRDGIVVHRPRLPPAHATRHKGIPVTTPVRTLLDLAAILPLRPLARAFEQAQVHLHLPPAPLAAEVLCRPRYRGNRRLRLILDGAVDPADVRSVLELRFLRLCSSHGIERPLVNERIGDWTPDFVWPDRMLIVETDGVDFHRTPAARRRDALKDAHFRALGFTVIRLTWADVVERPAETAALIATSVGSPAV